MQYFTTGRQSSRVRKPWCTQGSPQLNPGLSPQVWHSPRSSFVSDNWVQSSQSARKKSGDRPLNYLDQKWIIDSPEVLSKQKMLKNWRKNDEKKLVDPEKSICEFWNKNLKQNVSSYFSLVLALKTIDTQKLFWSVFLKTDNKVIDCQKQPKWHFWWSITFFVRFQKNRPKEHFFIYCF